MRQDNRNRKAKSHIVRGYIVVKASSYQEAAFKAMTFVPGFRLMNLPEEEMREDDKLHKNKI